MHSSVKEHDRDKKQENKTHKQLPAMRVCKLSLSDIFAKRELSANAGTEFFKVRRKQWIPYLFLERRYFSDSAKYTVLDFSFDSFHSCDTAHVHW